MDYKKTLDEAQSKEIIGFKLKDEKYRRAALKITGMSQFFDKQRERFCFNDLTHVLHKLKDLGVLDIWFEPVYKEEPKLEVGKWYKNKGYKNWLIYYESPERIYGFNERGDWYDDRLKDDFTGGEKPATDKEVEEALIREAERRGYKEANYKCMDYPDATVYDNSGRYFFKSSKNELWIGTELNADLIFKDGQWAEIISQPEEKPRTYEVEALPTENIGEFKATMPEKAKSGDTIIIKLL